MPLKLEPAPADGWSVIGRALDDLSPPKGLARLTPGVSASREATNPIPIYSIRRSALRKDGRPEEKLASAVRTGWRYLVMDRDNTIVVDLRSDKSDVLQLNRIRRGSAARRLIDAARMAEEGTDGKEFEVRVAVFPGLHIEALWLIAPDASRFILLRGEPRLMQSGELFERAAQAARGRTVPEGAADDIGGSGSELN